MSSGTTEICPFFSSTENDSCLRPGPGSMWASVLPPSIFRKVTRSPVIKVTVVPASLLFVLAACAAWPSCENGGVSSPQEASARESASALAPPADVPAPTISDSRPFQSSIHTLLQMMSRTSS